MFHATSPVLATNFHNMLEYRLKTSGVEFPKHHLLGGVMINTMALLVAKGVQAQLGHTLVSQVLAVKEEIMTLCLLSDIDVKFRFDTILEVPLNILVDGNIIGFDTPTLYFKRKPVAADQLHEAQVLFNFLALVRLFILQLGEKGVLDLVQDFNNTPRVEILPKRKTGDSRGRDLCTIRTTGSGARKVSRSKSPLVLGEYDVNNWRNAYSKTVGVIVAKDGLDAVSPKRMLNASWGRPEHVKRRGRLMRDENASSVGPPTRDWV